MQLLYGTFFKGKVKVLWSHAAEAILWNIWVERNSRNLTGVEGMGVGF